MSKYLLLLIAFFSAHCLQAQTFNNTTGGPIIDCGATPTTTCFPITVTGVGSMTATHGLESVCVNIAHTWDADLTLTLQAPDGTLISLSINNGGSGDNYTGTCFSATGGPGIAAGTAPFAGTYVPQGSLGGMNNGQNGDGIWNLCIEDNFSTEIGSLINWSITFSSTPFPPTPTCANNPPAGNSCQTATPVCNFVGYCGNTSSTYAPPHVWPELTTAFGPGGQCGSGGSIENNSFVTFVASATSASFNVWVTNSTLGNGIQMMFYDGNCGSGSVSVYGCYANPNLTPTGPTPFLVSASGLIIGNTYTLMFDGYAGDVCDYSLAPLSGVNILFVDPPSPSVCIGQSVVLNASGGNGIFNWTGPNLSSTTGSTVTASPTTTSSYTVTSVDPTGSCPVNLPFTITITNTPNPPTITSPVNYCQNATAVPLTAVGNLLEWYTVPTGGTASTTAPTPPTTTAGTTTYYVTQTLSCGTSIRVPIVVNVVAPPPAPTVSSPVGYCQGAGSIALTATGTGLLWYTTATGGTGSATSPIPSTGTVGSTIYYVSQTVSGCEGPRAAITVTISTTPAAPGVTSPVSYCQGTAAVPLTATGTNLLWYTVATGGVGSATAPTPSTAAVGTTTWYVDQANGSCRGPRAPIVVNVGAATPPPGTTNITYCQGGPAIALTAVGTSLLWYTAATGGTGSATAPTPSTAAVGSTTYYVTQTLSCGESVRQPLIVTIITTPAAPTVSSPVTYCQNVTAVALTATGTGLLWYTTATGGTGTATAPIPSTTTVGSTIYYVSQSSGACEGPRAPITVTINSIPAAPGVIVDPGCDPLNPVCPVTYCQGSTATALSAIGIGLLWYTTATGGTGTATAPIPSTATVGNTTYYVSQTINGCEGPRASITVTVVPPTALPTATTPITYCQGTTALALTATGTGLLWYTAATGGTGAAAAPIPSTAAAGSTTYYVSQTAAPCGESARLPIVVNINPTPAAPTTTSPVNYCQNVTATALSATGTNLLWYTTATGGTGSATAPVPSTASVGSTTYYVSQTTGICEGPRAVVTVNVGPLPAAPGVTPAISYCQNVTAAVLTATGTNLLWYTTATGGTGNATAPTPSTATQGNFNFYVSQTINGCEGPRSLITVTILPPTALPTATSPVNYCQGTTAVALTATGTGLLWYTVATGGTGNATAPTPSTATAGSTTYYVSQTAAPCGESARLPIVVNINPTPGIPTVTNPVIYCQNATASALTAAGTSLLWYTTATGGTGSSTAPVPSTATPGSTTYYVSQSLGVCEGPRTALTVTINSIPATPVAIATITYCQNVTATTLTATGTSLLWYTTATGGTGSATAPTPSTTVPGDFYFYVSQTINSCEGPRSLTTVTVLPSTVLPTSTTPIIYCQGATATALTATGTNLLWYTAATGGTGSAIAPTPSTATAGSTTYYVSQTAAPCGESARLPIVVNINPTPGIPTVTSPVVYCQNTTATALTATGTSLLWYTTATGGTGSATAPIPSTATPGSTIYYVSQSLGVCEGPRTSITVTVNATPVAPGVNGSIIYCQDAAATPLTATGSNLLWYTSASGGTGNTLAPTPSTITPGISYHYVSQTILSCEGPRSQITVTILPHTALPTASSPIEYCQGTTAIALTATGTGLLWYTSAAGGTGSSTAPTPSTVTAGSTTYYVSQTAAPCGESARLPVIVNINPTPPAPTVGGPVMYCQDAIAPPLSATGTNLLWYNTPLGGTGNPNAPDQYTAFVGITTYYVSQTLGVCEGPRASITVTINPYPDFGPDLRDTACAGDSINLSALFITTGYTFNWTLDGAPVSNPDAVKVSGVYQLEAINSVGCADTVLVWVTIQPPVPAFAGNDTTAIVGVAHTLVGSGGVAYEWTPVYPLNLASIQNPIAILDHDQLFEVKVTDVAGCVGTDKVFIQVYNGPTFYVPNAFSPNGDGQNDLFKVVPVGISRTDWFRIFNRFGEMVFETNKWMKGWDGTFRGKKQPAGNYVWMVKGVDKYGKVVEMKGTVLIVQ